MFAHWSASWPVLIGYVVVAGLHLAGLRRLLTEARTSGSASASRVELRREAALFHLGLLVVALALVSPLGFWSSVYLWARALQSLLVAVAGPGLIVLGAPWLAVSSPLRLRRGERVPVAAKPVPPWVSVLVVTVFGVVFLTWQVPALMDGARANIAVASAEHVSYLAAGLLLWLQLISSRPVTAPGSPLRRLVMLIGALGVPAVFGMVLAYSTSVLYPGYANAAHHIMTVLDDQQLAGAVLWMGMLAPLSIAGIALLMQWVNNEESADLSAGLDRLLTSRRRGWPSRPVIR